MIRTLVQHPGLSRLIHNAATKTRMRKHKHPHQHTQTHTQMQAEPSKELGVAPNNVGTTQALLWMPCDRWGLDGSARLSVCLSVCLSWS